VLSGGRAPGEEMSARIPGAAGDWRNHFQDEHVDYFKGLYNPLLLS